MDNFGKAYHLLKEFKKDKYLNGSGVLTHVGPATLILGQRAVLIYDIFPGSDNYILMIKKSLQNSGVKILGEICGPKPNAPLEDLHRISEELKKMNPEVVISFGGGSTIDVTKAAEVLRTFGGGIDEYFGTGLVSTKIEESSKKLHPHVAIQTAASSGAHLTKYSNITNLDTNQKKLIVDEAIIPIQPVFDYDVTINAPLSLTIDGALDGMAHSLEVLYGSGRNDNFEKISEVAQESVRLIVEYLPSVINDLKYKNGREALGLATDLGGYAIMLGGTNGGHLTSFSLVDILSHGRACAIMNPYYTVFFSPAIEKPLRIIGEIFRKSGYIQGDINNLVGRDLGIVVAEAMILFQKSIGFPTTLGEVKGFTDNHIERALSAAKDPQLKMKLLNMPTPLKEESIDEYMKPILLAAKTGDFSLIQCL